MHKFLYSYECLWRAGACWHWLEVTGNSDSSEPSLSLTVLREACSGRTQRDPSGSVWERSLNPPRVHKHKNGFARGVVNAWGPRTKKTEFGCQRSRRTLGNASCLTLGLSWSPCSLRLVLQLNERKACLVTQSLQRQWRNNSYNCHGSPTRGTK